MKGLSEIQHAYPDLPILGSAFSYLRGYAPALAAGMVGGGHCAMAGFGRMAFANPDFPNQLREKAAIDKVCMTCGGRAIADRLHGRGYRVIYSGTRPERPADRDYIGCNIGESEQRVAAFRYFEEKYGRLDALVNNAGVAPLVREDLLSMTEESFDRVVGINLKGTMFMCQLAANLMLKPRIVNIGSISTYTSSTARGEYCISKAGVGMVTQLMEDCLAAEGNPVFEVRPGIIATDMTEKVHEKYQKLIDGGLLPIPRFGDPADVADMVEACCTGLLDYAGGQVLNADGGFSLRRL